MTTGSKKRRGGSYGTSARRSAVWDVGGRVVIQGTMFVVSIFLARILSPADFGITAAARFFITLSSRLTQLGLNVSLVRMKDIRPEHASSVFVINLVMGVVVFITLTASSTALGRYYGNANVAQIFPVAALVFLIAPFGTVASAMMRRHLEYRKQTLVQVIDAVTGILSSLGLAILGFGYWSLVYGPIAGAVVSTLARAYLSPWRFSLRFSRSALRDTLNFGVGFQAKKILQFVSGNFDNVLVGRTLGVMSLGYYDKAYGLMLQLTDRLSLDVSLMRIFAVIHDQPERFRNAMLKGTQALSVLMFPALAFAGTAAEELVVVLFGPKWIPAVGPFRVLAFVGMIRSAMRPMNSANEALGLVWLQTGQQMLSVALMTIGITVGSRWGVTGAAIGLVPSVVVDMCLAVRLLTRNSAVTAKDILVSLWPAVLMTAGMCVAVLATRILMSHLEAKAWVTLPVLSAVALASYGAAVLWTPFSSVAAIVQESVDDVVPWMRRLKVGILRQSKPLLQE